MTNRPRQQFLPPRPPLPPPPPPLDALPLRHLPPPLHRHQTTDSLPLQSNPSSCRFLPKMRSKSVTLLEDESLMRSLKNSDRCSKRDIQKSARRFSKRANSFLTFMLVLVQIGSWPLIAVSHKTAEKHEEVGTTLKTTTSENTVLSETVISRGTFSIPVSTSDSPSAQASTNESSTNNIIFGTIQSFKF